MRLALFDLDNTLLAGDSDYEWGQFLVDRGVLEREAYEAQNRAYYEQYDAGTLDIHEYLGFALRPLAAHTPADLARWHADFMRSAHPADDAAPAARALVRATSSAAISAPSSPPPTASSPRRSRASSASSTSSPPSPRRATAASPGGSLACPCFRDGKVRRLDDWLGCPGRRLADFGERPSTATRTTTCRCSSA